MGSAADLALAYQSEGRFAESEALAREALEFNRKKHPDDWQRFRAESLLGASLAGQKKYAEAEPLLLEGYQGMLARKDRMGVPEWYHLDRAREWIVQLYQDRGKRDKAVEWRGKLQVSQAPLPQTSVGPRIEHRAEGTSTATSCVPAGTPPRPSPRWCGPNARAQLSICPRSPWPLRNKIGCATNSIKNLSLLLLVVSRVAHFASSENQLAPPGCPDPPPL
jgi:hypothetical protein